jgi:hypothetical protein
MPLNDLCELHQFVKTTNETHLEQPSHNIGENTRRVAHVHALVHDRATHSAVVTEIECLLELVSVHVQHSLATASLLV